MNPIRRLVTEAHRRSMWQVLGIYLVGSWAAYQVASELTDRLALPDWVPGFAIVLLTIGLPIVLATAFVQEGAPILRGPSFEPTDPTLLPMSEPVQAPRLHRVLFTWQKAIAGGIAAFMLLTISAAGYMGMRTNGIGPIGSLVGSGALAERDRVLIADFAATGVDSSLASAVTQAFRTDFAQSPTVTVIEPAAVRAVLLRMSRDPSSPLNAELAKEVAVRDNIKAVLTGEVTRLGSGWVFSAQLQSVADGVVLASFRESAADSTMVLAAVDALSQKLRTKIGESFRTLRADRPLEAVSTPSLEALRKYTQGARAADFDREYELAVSLLKEAIALDSTFAAAWRKLGAVYNNMGASEELRADAIKKAYQYRDRLTDRERYHATAFYELNVRGDNPAAITAYRTLLETYPNDYAAWNNVGIAYTRTGDHENGALAYRKSTEIDSMNTPAYYNAIFEYNALGDDKQAQQVLDLVARRFNKPGFYYEAKFFVDGAKRDFAAAEQTARELLQRPNASPTDRYRGRLGLGAVAMVRGKLAEGERQRAAASALARERGNLFNVLDLDLMNARTDYWVRRDPRRAIATLDAALKRLPMSELKRYDRPYLDYARLYALTGQTERARALVSEFESQFAADERAFGREQLTAVEGALNAAARNFTGAIEKLREAAGQGPCGIRCYASEIGLAFEQGQQPDSAIVAYELYLSSYEGRAMMQDQNKLAPTHERLAELYEAKGDKNNAALHAAKFVELWQNADAELQPRVQAKRALLQRLQSR